MAIVFFSEGVLDRSIGAVMGKQGSCTSADALLPILNSCRERGVQIGIVAFSADTLKGASSTTKTEFKNPSALKLATVNSLSEEQGLNGDQDKFFVGKWSFERAEALKAGFTAAIPHPRLVSEVLAGHTLIYARVSGFNDTYRDERLNRFLKMPMAPVYFTCRAEGYAYVITSTKAANIIADMGFDVTLFGEEHDPQETDLFLIGADSEFPVDNSKAQSGIEALVQVDKARFVVCPEEEGLLLALPSDVDAHSLYFAVAPQRQCRRLLSDSTLLRHLGNGISLRTPCVKLNPRATLTKDEIEILEKVISPDTIKAFHAPYVGHAPLIVKEQTYWIRSRHKAHDQNRIVTEALLQQIHTIGGGLLKVRPDDFVLGTTVLSNVEAELSGTEPDSFVIISAHLDSIAIDVSGNYPAPGGDDDASGIAAVLAAAEAAVRITRQIGPFKRSLRFVLFNAEEEVVLGSKCYAAKQAYDNVKIEGVFQLDMIGYHGGQPNVFEIHAGYDASSAVQACSLELAQTVTDMAGLVSKSLHNFSSPQVYPRKYGRDPAQGNSDHTSFHQQGYAACMISEDYNSDPGDSKPDPQINPHYHKSTDETIDYAYAANIARAVVAAAFLTAKG